MKTKISKIKLAGIVALVIVLVLIGASAYFASLHEPAKTFTWGVTFSPAHVEYLGFDWKTAYLDMLNDLKPKKLRLMTYWEGIEPAPEKYDFSQTAEMLAEAGKRGVEVILVVGHKQPRWPECHHPDWYERLSNSEKEEAQLRYVRNAVNYYKKFDAVKVWQVENEPFLMFGENCRMTPKELILKEMELVRSLDSRPIMVTDSGELGRWLPAARLGPDIFGTTMYRVVHNPTIGYFKYPLPPSFFHAKAGIVKKFSKVDNIVGIELQAEPWFTNGADGPRTTDLETQLSLMNPKIFREYVDYAKDAGFSENYLWGVEWWYWLAKEKNNWGMWEEARQLLSEN
jgi:hypothetical protein